MAHVHELIDFVAAAYIVHKRNVLLVHHKKLGKWLPVGGHIELDEDSDTALIREIWEESGIRKDDLVFINNKPDMADTKFLMVPQYVDIHGITDKHRHLCMTYFVRSKTTEATHNTEEHNSIRWFTEKELEKTEMPASVRFLAKEAIKTLNSM